MCILSIELIYILSSWGKAKTKGEEVGKRWFHQVYWMVCVRVYSSIWHYMALYGSMWQYMAVIENKCGWCCGLASAVNLSRSQMADPWLLACDRLALNAGGNPVGESRSRGWGCQGRQSQRQSQLSFVFCFFFITMRSKYSRTKDWCVERSCHFDFVVVLYTAPLDQHYF